MDVGTNGSVSYRVRKKCVCMGVYSIVDGTHAKEQRFSKLRIGLRIIEWELVAKNEKLLFLGRKSRE